MKKTLLSLTLLLAFVLCACGGKSVSDETPDINQKAEALLNEIDYEDELSEIDEDMISLLYSELDLNDVTDKKVYVSSGATAEELALFLCKDVDAARRVMSAATQRVLDQRESYEGYNPKEVLRLDSMKIMRRGNLVVLTVSSDPDKANEIFIH